MGGKKESAMKSSLRIMGVVFLSILLAVSLTACGGGGGNGGDGNGGNGGDGAATYTASGTYTYDLGTGTLTLNTTSSDFECEGPELGTEQYAVLSISPTTMIWDEDGEQMTWTRESGTSGDILGTWESSDDETGNSWEITFGSDGSFSVVGSIVQCEDGDGNGGGDGDGNGGDISMITPYVNESDMASVNEAFSSDDSAPWGFAHNGIDFFPIGNLKPFQAVCSGDIDTVALWQNDISLNWQVNVRIICNSTYSVDYAFEPMTPVQADGETQLANISVSVGQAISQGDIIGYLFTSGEGSHVHFGFYKNSVSICPESYFTPEARDSILNLIHKDNPDWNMCY
jgi:hypothetical protein